MKLLKNQYQDILGVLDAFDIKHDKLSLVKKKGRIMLHIEGIEAAFEFFRRKSFSLSEHDHQLQKSEHYELTIDGKPTTADDWNGVVSHFNSWLSVVSLAP